MGQDLEILFKLKESDEPELVDYSEDIALPYGYTVCAHPSHRFDSRFPEYTHCIESSARYWAPTYDRGPWPEICACLLVLLRNDHVSDILYGSDSGYFDAVDLSLIEQYNYCYVDRNIGV